MRPERHPASPAARSDAAARRIAVLIQIAAERAERIARAHYADAGPARAARDKMQEALAAAPPADAGAGSPAMWAVLRTAMNCWADADDADRRERWSGIVMAAADGVIKDEAGYRRPRPTGRDLALPED